MQNLGESADGQQRTRFEDGVVHNEGVGAGDAAPSAVLHLVGVEVDGGGAGSTPSGSSGYESVVAFDNGEGSSSRTGLAA